MSAGRPAAGVEVLLERQRGEELWDTLGRGETDADGRLRSLMPEDEPLADRRLSLTSSTRRLFRVARHRDVLSARLDRVQAAALASPLSCPAPRQPVRLLNVSRLVTTVTISWSHPSMPSRPPRPRRNRRSQSRDWLPSSELSRKANSAFERAYPGDSGDRQPVHTVYGGAHLFKADTAPRLGTIALKALTDNAPDADTFARALDVSRPPADGRSSRPRSMSGSLPSCAPSRWRISGSISRTATVIVTTKKRTGTRARPPTRWRPASCGIRCRPSSGFASSRSRRSFRRGASAPSIWSSRHWRWREPSSFPNFFITIPKVTSPAQVAAVATVCGRARAPPRLRPGILGSR